MLKPIVLSIVFLVVYLGSIVLYMTRVYAVVEPRVRKWLGQRMGIKITDLPRIRSAGWTIQGKHTAQQSIIVFLAQLGFVVVSVIIPMMAWLTLIFGILALLNGGM
jgi:hypothetical protein